MGSQSAQIGGGSFHVWLFRSGVVGVTLYAFYRSEGASPSLDPLVHYEAKRLQYPSRRRQMLRIN